MKDLPSLQQRTESTGQSALTSKANSSSMDSTFRDAAVLQQITTELNGAVSEEDKIVVINKTVLNLTKQNGH